MYLLVIMFAGSWFGQFMFQLIEFSNEQRQLGVVFSWSEFLPRFFASTFENWQSEWFQLIFQAILLLGAKHLLFRVDAQDLERIEQKIDQVRSSLGQSEEPPSDIEDASDKRPGQTGR
ncbi:hypothetical protein [Stackebrandtia soli]|uniref:hypothetical protein n=1 Tax=Stackebrandtia soli TaxID=1892856 RepID=UPI0039E74FE4